MADVRDTIVLSSARATGLVCERVDHDGASTGHGARWCAWVRPAMCRSLSGRGRLSAGSAECAYLPLNFTSIAKTSAENTMPIALCSQNPVFGLSMGHHSIHATANAIEGERKTMIGDDVPVNLAAREITAVNTIIINGPASQTRRERCIANPPVDA